ncbi:MAG TPA: chromosomal replication initiator DnaA [Devosia sp.]|nr:chromosomal replication initiator DnaA [Devosia sp.]
MTGIRVPARGGNGAVPEQQLPVSRAQEDLSRADRLGDHGASILARIVARAHQVSVTELFHHTRSRAPIAHTRQMAMYLMHVVLGRSLTQVGQFFRRDRTTVAHACSRIEDLRDVPEFDEELNRLEEEILRKTASPERNNRPATGTRAND